MSHHRAKTVLDYTVIEMKEQTKLVDKTSRKLSEFKFDVKTQESFMESIHQAISILNDIIKLNEAGKRSLHRATLQTAIEKLEEIASSHNDESLDIYIKQECCEKALNKKYYLSLLRLIRDDIQSDVKEFASKSMLKKERKTERKVESKSLQQQREEERRVLLDSTKEVFFSTKSPKTVLPSSSSSSTTVLKSPKK